MQPTKPREIITAGCEVSGICGFELKWVGTRSFGRKPIDTCQAGSLVVSSRTISIRANIRETQDQFNRPDQPSIDSLKFICHSDWYKADSRQINSSRQSSIRLIFATWSWWLAAVTGDQWSGTVDFSPVICDTFAGTMCHRCKRRRLTSSNSLLIRQTNRVAWSN